MDLKLNVDEMQIKVQQEQYINENQDVLKSLDILLSELNHILQGDFSIQFKRFAQQMTMAMDALILENCIIRSTGIYTL